MWPLIASFLISTVISYITRPRVEAPKPGVYEVPEVEEGRPHIKVYGTDWIDDPQMLGFKKMGTDRIRKSGGKK